MMDFVNGKDDIPYKLYGTPLKNMNVSWDNEIPNIWKNKKYPKPPTSLGK